MRRFRILTILAAIMLLAAVSYVYAAVPQLMNYQGRLTDNLGQPLDTTVSMTFTVYDDSTGGSAIWTETHPTVVVTEGGFNVLLGEFAAAPDTIFSDPERWLGIVVGADPEITPRTRLVSVPYAYHSSSVDFFSPGPNNVASGLYSFVAGDNNTLLADYSSIAGGQGNVIDVSEIADTVLDTTDIFNYSPTLLMSGEGPRDNHPSAFVGGGLNNHAHCSFSAIVGGFSNQSNGHYAFVGGGYYNKIGTDPTGCVCGDYSMIGGGALNSVDGFFGTISGGIINGITGCYVASTIGGGLLNTTVKHVSTIGGGYMNYADGFAATVSGGEANQSVADYSTVSGGQANTASDDWSYVGGGHDNVASGYEATIGGGRTNIASNGGATVAGGIQNVASGQTSTVGGGGVNQATGSPGSTVAGGQSNLASSNDATVGGGIGNTASGTGATVPGGSLNTASGTNSFAAGAQAQAVNNNTFVWNDGSAGAFSSTNTNQFLIHASGGVGIKTTKPQYLLHIGGDNTALGAFPVYTAPTSINNLSTPPWDPEYQGLLFNAYTIGVDRRYGDIVSLGYANVGNQHGGSVIRFLTNDEVTADGIAVERMRIERNGNVGIGTDLPTAKLDVNGATGYDQIRMRTSFTPTGTGDASGNIGDMAWDDNFMYIKTNAGWKRTPLTIF